MPSIEQLRNIGIIAHIDAGKTTTTERMLFYSGRSHRIGDIDEGTTVMDYLDEERTRGITIVSAAASFPWGEHLIHLIDTPGHIDFTAEVERSLRVIDGAVVIFSGVEGVEAQSEKVWYQADHYQLPRLGFINKLDRIGASFSRTMAEINDKFADKAVAIQLPVGAENDFQAVIDLLTMELITFVGDDGEHVQRDPIPETLAEEARLARELLIERLADGSDALAEAYLEGREIATDQLAAELRRQTLDCRLVPVLAGAAKNNVGVQPLIDAILAYLPSPADIAEVAAFKPKDHEPTTVEPDPEAPFAGFIFKLVASPSADLYYLRTYSGTLRLGAKLYVPRTRDTIRIKRILRLYAKSTEAIEEAGPGDIVGLIGPRNLVTGDTLCEAHRQVAFEKMRFPEPVLSIAIEPASTRENDRLDEALALVCREDPTLELSRDENTGQRLLAGMGELHLEINVKRLQQEFRVPVRAGEPRVAYRETLCGAVTTTGVFHRLVGETELRASVTVSLRPKEKTGAPFRIESKLRGPGGPGKAFVQAALQGLTDGLKTGGNAGYPLIYVDATLDALEVPADTPGEGPVLGAVLQALDQAIAEAGTLLLEPLMSLDILTPESHLGDVTNDLHTRRGLIHQVADVSDLKRVSCEVPLSEMFGFSKALPKLTGGRGSFTMEPTGYLEVDTTGNG